MHDLETKTPGNWHQRKSPYKCNEVGDIGDTTGIYRITVYAKKASSEGVRYDRV
ncbi:MAG: hypothetical protein ICV79_17990 [Flavisolibacter sp.]|nr:hypothetical protein [Flavisolibacter sp.]